MKIQRKGGWSVVANRRCSKREGRKCWPYEDRAKKNWKINIIGENECFEQLGRFKLGRDRKKGAEDFGERS